MTTKELYQTRINEAIDYINDNLSEKLSIDDICQAACFSTYHFHRIFKAFTGESLYAFVNRLRVEKAAYFFLTRKLSVTEVALLVGFNDTAVFARAFKKRFGCSASDWKKQNSKIHQDFSAERDYYKRKVDCADQSLKPHSLVVTAMEETNFMYIRYTGAFSGNSKLFAGLHEQLLDELNKEAVSWRQDAGFFVVYHDSAGITEERQLRISYGVLADSGKNSDSILGSFIIEKNYYLIAEFLLDNDEYGKAWSTLYRDILPDSGYEPVDGYCFENYADDCYDSQTGKTLVRIGIPVRKIK
jgi:AraC family transcriptional regulator